MVHESVLLKEAIDGLDIVAGDTYLDATLGGGGHLLEVWRRHHDSVSLYGIDADQVSLSIAEERLKLEGVESKTAVLNFRNIENVKEIFSITPSKILFDLGWNTLQFEEGGRGFSFKHDEPLLMTFKDSLNEDDTSAYDVVNNWAEESLADVIYGYGEEKFARRIAKKIVEARSLAPIKTSKQLAEIVVSAVPMFYRFGRLHPATKTFQAIRIAVNNELQALQEGLLKSFDMLPSSGRIAVISFHSLEDRIVKNFFRDIVEQEKGENIYKKPMTPSEQEIEKNPRSRSAKLRIIKKY